MVHVFNDAFYFILDSFVAQRRCELFSTEVRERGASMRRDGEETSIHRGRGEERRSADRRQSHGTTTGTESSYDHRSRGNNTIFIV